ncbi:FAD-dependent oxidoreductase [Actinoplanes subtropicus]|uniref:FAD-dependent oxidoreductase n=1 Tax=Actinoplanes subtropicus TaxID=543632 RepID=UPI0004C38E58|nr:FAD-binding protein [Actinoplanes subtropicus]
MIDILDLTADVLVAGGGPAGAWAALKAAQAGADVILVDKGYLGTSGATASAGTGVWYVEPETEAREAAMASRENLNGHLSDRRWMARVLDQTYANINELATAGRYPFPILDDGSELRRGVQGPEYMRRMRAWLKRAGVRILDHSPVLELLTDPAGAVAGVAGHRRQLDQPYRVRAGAVVLATGGCAFLSRALGCDVNTGDGALFAAEVGAAFSGMEFSNAYAIAPEFSTVTKTAYYNYATFYREDGTVLEGAGSQRGRSVIARALLTGRVFARLDLAGETVRAAMRLGQPNFFLPFDRMRIDPFTDRFPITLLLEGTVRGTGGVRVADEDCSTGVAGLYVAGDAATRELICGGFTGGGSHNSAWAMSSGTWAGTAAARHARALGPAAKRRRLIATGQAGLRPTGAQLGTHHDVVRAVQAETHPYEKNYLRHGDVLAEALATLDELWTYTSAHTRGPDPVGGRQAAAMVAHARWMYTAALARTESRGMHKRLDYPDTDPTRRHRLLVGGLDELWTKADPVRPHTPLDLAVAS